MLLRAGEYFYKLPQLWVCLCLPVTIDEFALLVFARSSFGTAKPGQPSGLRISRALSSADHRSGLPKNDNRKQEEALTFQRSLPDDAGKVVAITEKECNTHEASFEAKPKGAQLSLL